MGSHSNGFSLARKIAFDAAGHGVDDFVEEARHDGRQGDARAHADLRPAGPGQVLMHYPVKNVVHGIADITRRLAREPCADRARGSPSRHRPRKLAGAAHIHVASADRQRRSGRDGPGVQHGPGTGDGRQSVLRRQHPASVGSVGDQELAIGRRSRGRRVVWRRFECEAASGFRPRETTSTARPSPAHPRSSAACSRRERPRGGWEHPCRRKSPPPAPACRRAPPAFSRFGRRVRVGVPRVSTPPAWIALTTAGVFKTVASSVLQVKHQLAVKSTSTVRGSAGGGPAPCGSQGRHIRTREDSEPLFHHLDQAAGDVAGWGINLSKPGNIRTQICAGEGYCLDPRPGFRVRFRQRRMWHSLAARLTVRTAGRPLERRIAVRGKSG